jgi:glycine oxidase
MHDVVIIGAGVAGLGIGWQLAERDVDVLILERDRAGAGASRAAAGMLAPTAELDFQERDLLELGRASLEAYPDFVEELEAAGDIDLDYRTEGTLVVAGDRDDGEALDRIYEYQRELGLDVERLSTERAREIEPALAPDVHRALVCPGDHQIDPGRLVDALVEAFEQAGGILRESTPVRKVWCDEGVRGVVTDEGARIEADRVVVAAGAWTSRIEGVPSGGLPHVRPVRGEMLALDLGAPPVVEHVVRAPHLTRPDVYLAPKSDGRLVVGATSEERGFDSQPTAGGIFELLWGAKRVVPAIYDQHLLDVWTGFRPVTLDAEPVLGPTDIEGLWVATGHGRNGILLTPLTAYEMADAMLADQLPNALEGFTPTGALQ